MEAVVNALIGVVVLGYDLVRGLLEWGDKALLVGGAAGLGSYLGVRSALRRQATPVSASVGADLRG